MDVALTEESSFAACVKRLRADADKMPMPGRLERLSMDAIMFATEVFQPRDINAAWLATDSHVKALVEAVKTAEGNAFDPVTVWWSGLHWYVIDGHHRMMAYRRAKKEDEKLPLDTIPVDVFDGSLDEAIRQSAVLNSKDKLPMTRADKLERAWKLVCLGNGWTGEDIVSATTVSLRTVATMRKERKGLLAQGKDDPLEVTWADVLSKVSPVNHDDDWKERQAVEWQKRLVRMFGKKFAEQPEIAARAIELYSARLPEELVSMWPDEAKKVADSAVDPEF